MARPEAFAELLADKLGEQPAPATVRGGPSRAHVATVSAFFSEFAAGSPPAFRPHLRSLASTPYGQIAPPAPRTSRRRRLSAGEQAALDQMNTLGARVDAAFTAGELRSAFRSLARTYHPDRHPHSTANERARLSLAFVTLHDAYRALQACTVATG